MPWHKRIHPLLYACSKMLQISSGVYLEVLKVHLICSVEKKNICVGILRNVVSHPGENMIRSCEFSS